MAVIAHRSVWVWASLWIVSIVACAELSTRPDAVTVNEVDLARYAGTWYEIARLPTWFQRHCVDSKVSYTLRVDGAVDMHHECVTDSGGVETAHAIAIVVDGKTHARLNVAFDNWFDRWFGASHEGNYWILDLDPEYRTAVVGTTDRRHFWVLARSPQLDEANYRQLVDVGQRFGYPVERLIRDRR
jgi:apolipoprotein D and lipocalin family protein